MRPSRHLAPGVIRAVPVVGGWCLLVCFAPSIRPPDWRASASLVGTLLLMLLAVVLTDQVSRALSGALTALNLLLMASYSFGILERRELLVTLTTFAAASMLSFLHPSKTRWLVNGTISAGALLAALLMADPLLRLTVVSDFNTYPKPDLPILTRQVKSAVLEDRALIGDLAIMSGRPATPSYYRMKTDERGFTNGPDFDFSSPKSVIILGDSYSVSDYYTRDESQGSWGAQLAREMGDGVVNLSMVATGPAQHYWTLWHELPSLRTCDEGSVLWALFSGNDLDDDSPTPQDRAAFFPGRWATLQNALNNLRRQSGLRILLKSWLPEQESDARPDNVTSARLPDGQVVLLFTPYLQHSRRTLEEVRSHPNYSRLETLLVQGARLCRQRRLQLHVLLFPSKEDIYGWAVRGERPWTYDAPTSTFAAAVGTTCAEGALSFHDATPFLRARAKQQSLNGRPALYLSDDTHWSFAGHQAALEYVRSVLQLARSPSGRIVPPKS